MKLECRSKIGSVVTKRRMPDGRVNRETQNPITPIADMTTGHVHFVRLGPAVKHFSGRAIAHYHAGRIQISEAYEQNLVFYEELCMRGDYERGIEPSPVHWAKFKQLRTVIYEGVKPENIPEDFWHPYIRDLRSSGSTVPRVDMTKVLEGMDELDIDVDDGED